MKFLIVWATARPEIFKKTCKEWIDKCSNKDNLIIKVAVNSEEHAQQLSEYDVKVVKTNRVGVTYPIYVLTSSLNKNDYADTDIVILSSDDFFPPDNWDIILQKEFENYNGCIVFNDENQPPGPRCKVDHI